MKKVSVKKKFSLITGLTALIVIYLSSSCAKPTDEAPPHTDSTNAIIANYYPDTIFGGEGYMNTPKRIYIYDNKQQLQSIDIYQLISGNDVMRYQIVYEYTNGSILPVKRHFYDVISSPYPIHTSYLQYDGNGRKIYDSCRETSYATYTASRFFYPDTRHIVVHQITRRGITEYFTDTVFLRNADQIDSIRKYNNITYAAPGNYLYTQYISINDTMPNMFYKLSSRQADFYAPSPGAPAGFINSLFNGYTKFILKSFTTSKRFDDWSYYFVSHQYPNKAPELITETSDSTGYVRRRGYYFLYRK